jgi:hypothetical protein
VSGAGSRRRAWGLAAPPAADQARPPAASGEGHRRTADQPHGRAGPAAGVSPEFRERHIEAPHTGALVAVDTFFVGVLKGRRQRSTCRPRSTAPAATPGRGSTPTSCRSSPSNCATTTCCRPSSSTAPNSRRCSATTAARSAAAKPGGNCQVISISVQPGRNGVASATTRPAPTTISRVRPTSAYLRENIDCLRSGTPQPPADPANHS